MTANACMGAASDLFWDDQPPRATRLLVDLVTTSYVNIRVITVPVQASDLLVITGELNLTQNTGRDEDGTVTGRQYAVGVGTSLWIYDASAPAAERAATWLRLGTNGENVTPEGHHIQQGLTRPYVVPADWAPGHTAAVVLRADVHSTGHDSNRRRDVVFVEQHGVLMCARYRPLKEAP